MQGACAVPCFCFRIFKSGSWVFLVSLNLLSRICPNCACMQLFLVPYSFFELCCLKRGVSRCKPCSTAAEGPRSQPVSPPQEPATTRSVPRMATDLSYPIAGLRPMSVLIGQCPAILFVNCFYIIPGTY